MMDNNILSVFRNGNEILLTENEGLDGSTLIPVIYFDNFLRFFRCGDNNFSFD